MKWFALAILLLIFIYMAGRMFGAGFLRSFRNAITGSNNKKEGADAPKE